MHYRYYSFAIVAICMMGLGISGCGKSSTKTDSKPPLSSKGLEIETAREGVVESVSDSTPSTVDSKTNMNSETIVVLTENDAELCAIANYPFEGGETLDVRNYDTSELRAFERNNGRLKFGGSVYAADVDYDRDGIKDFYLTTAKYNYSTFREDWTGFYIVPGVWGNSEVPEPDFTKKALKSIFFASLNKHSLNRRNPPDIATEGKFIVTAKVTPIKFKNKLYLKVEAQLTDAQNNEYRSAYTNAPDWTTFAKVNQFMEIQPICNTESD